MSQWHNGLVLQATVMPRSCSAFWSAMQHAKAKEGLPFSSALFISFTVTPSSGPPMKYCKRPAGELLKPKQQHSATKALLNPVSPWGVQRRNPTLLGGTGWCTLVGAGCQGGLHVLLWDAMQDSLDNWTDGGVQSARTTSCPLSVFTRVTASHMMHQGNRAGWGLLVHCLPRGCGCRARACRACQ